MLDDVLDGGERVSTSEYLRNTKTILKRIANAEDDEAALPIWLCNKAGHEELQCALVGRKDRHRPRGDNHQWEAVPDDPDETSVGITIPATEKLLTEAVTEKSKRMPLPDARGRWFCFDETHLHQNCRELGITDTEYGNELNHNPAGAHQWLWRNAERPQYDVGFEVSESTRERLAPVVDEKPLDLTSEGVGEVLKAGSWVLIRAKVLEVYGADVGLTVELFSKTDQYKAIIRRDLVVDVIDPPLPPEPSHDAIVTVDKSSLIFRWSDKWGWQNGLGVFYDWATLYRIYRSELAVWEQSYTVEPTDA